MFVDSLEPDRTKAAHAQEAIELINQLLALKGVEGPGARGQPAGEAAHPNMAGGGSHSGDGGSGGAVADGGGGDGGEAGDL